MIRVPESDQYLDDVPRILPRLNHNQLGPWKSSKTPEGPPQTKSLVINIPVQLLASSDEATGDTLAERLIVESDDTQPINGRIPLRGPNLSAVHRQAVATGSLLNLLADKSGIVATSSSSVGCLMQHVKERFHTQGTTKQMPTFYWSVRPLWHGGSEPNRLDALRLTKHLMSPNYSDSLAFDLQRDYARKLRNKSQLPGATQRAKNTLRGARSMPTRAHLGVDSLQKLMQAYRDYGSSFKDGSPLIFDWTTHFARCCSESEPLQCPLSERPGANFRHALSPELLLDPRLNKQAEGAGLIAGGLVRPSRCQWVLVGESPGDTPLPAALLHLIDAALARPLYEPAEEQPNPLKRPRTMEMEDGASNLRSPRNTA